MRTHKIPFTFPDYLNTKTTEKVCTLTERATTSLFYAMENEFGRAALRSAVFHEFVEILHALASDISTTVAGDLSVERTRDAQQASFNMLQATLAGIELGRNKE